MRPTTVSVAKWGGTGAACEISHMYEAARCLSSPAMFQLTPPRGTAEMRSAYYLVCFTHLADALHHLLTS